MSDPDEKHRGSGDKTNIGGAPPAIPQPPADAPAPRTGEQTHIGAAPPRPPVAPPPALTPEGDRPPSSAPPSNAAEPGAAPEQGIDDEGTVFLGADAIERRPRVLLNREQPPGHPGSETLDGDQYLMGRARTCDIKLFSPTASREHARLTRRADGWYVEPYAGKIVLANGSVLRQPMRLEHRMRLQLGGDELVVIDQSAAIRSVPPAPAPAAPPRPRWLLVAALGALAAAALAAAWLLLRR